MRKKFIVLIVLTLSGCMSRELEPKMNLPSNAKNIQQLGNHHCYYELEIGGKNRKFITVMSGNRNALVELRD